MPQNTHIQQENKQTNTHTHTHTKGGKDMSIGLNKFTAFMLLP